MIPIQRCAVGFGELLWDELPHATLPGGAPSNFAWHAQQLGAHSVVVSAVGDDQSGRDLTQWLGTIGLEAAHVQVNGRPTGRVRVSVDEQNEPRYVIGDDAAWDGIAWDASLDALAERADCVCFGSLSQRSPITRQTLYRFLRATRPECLRLFDVNLRHPMPDADIVRESLELANVVKLNESEWPFAAKCVGLSSDWRSGGIELLRRTNVQLIAITRGARGSVLITEGQAITLPADAVEVEDTIGAGDAFAAALATGLMYGMPLGEVQIAATKVSAFVCTQPGATPRFPRELRELMAIPAVDVQFPNPGLRLPGKHVVVPRGNRASAQETSSSPS